MAVEATEQYLQKIFTTQVLGSHFCIKSPVFFMDLAEATLSGWCFSQQTARSSPADISIAYQDESFYVDASILEAPKVVDDLLDALNEFFLCLSYLTAGKNNTLKLLHCASYVQDRQNIILLGEKNSGKSQQVFTKAMAGYKIYADDLLLWHPKKSEFIALGLPLRLRRSAISLTQDDSIKDRFLIGKHVLYSHKKFFNQALLGERFSIDKIKVMNQSFEPIDIPIHQFLSRLEQSLISDNFLSYKRDI